MDLNVSEQDHTVDFNEHGSEPSNCTKSGNFLASSVTINFSCRTLHNRVKNLISE
jgi:hypothetical protein